MINSIIFVHLVASRRAVPVALPRMAVHGTRSMAAGCWKVPPNCPTMDMQLGATAGWAAGRGRATRRCVVTCVLGDSWLCVWFSWLLFLWFSCCWPKLPFWWFFPFTFSLSSLRFFSMFASSEPAKARSSLTAAGCTGVDGAGNNQICDPKWIVLGFRSVILKTYHF